MTGATLSDSGPHSVPAGRASPGARQRTARRTLLLLATVCILPVVASYLAYYVWQPQGRINYGELLTPTPVPAHLLPGIGQPGFTRSEMQGLWTLLYAGPSSCAASCAQALYLMRQSRLAQGQEMNRVARLWIVTDGEAPDGEHLRAHDGLRIAAAAPEWLAALPGASSAQHVYLVDPLGNLIMRFPEAADPGRVVKDLQRLLKYSALGRG